MRFYIYGLVPPVEGQHDGQTWNGWLCPSFPKASAEKIVKAWNEGYPDGFDGPNAVETAMERKPCAWFDEATRRFWFYCPDDDQTQSYDAHVEAGVELWDIGAECWTWEREECAT